MDYRIRLGKQWDIPSMVELLNELFSIEVDFQYDAFKHVKGLELLLASQEACVMVAEYNNKVIGMCTVQILVSTAQGTRVGLVEDVVVKKEHRGHGVGKSLVKALEKWSQSHGLSRLQLLADKDNKPALNFYNRENWKMTNLICYRKM